MIKMNLIKAMPTVTTATFFFIFCCHCFSFSQAAHVETLSPNSLYANYLREQRGILHGPRVNPQQYYAQAPQQRGFLSDRENVALGAAHGVLVGEQLKYVARIAKRRQT